MKKFVGIGVLILLLAPPVSAQLVQRATQMPNFFIPDNALKTQSEPEKLPPVEKMLYDGRPAPIVQEMMRKQQEEAAQKAANRQKNSVFPQAQEPEKLAVTEQKEEKAAEIAVPKQISESVAAKPAEQPTLPQRTSVAAAENSKMPAVTQAEQPKNSPDSADSVVPVDMASAPQPTSVPQSAEQNLQQDPFQVILDEYKRDIQSIAAGKPFQNERLRLMIGDYKDIERSL